MSLLETGDIGQSRAHFDRAIELYYPVEHRPLSTRFSVDTKVSVLSYRSLALWMLGYPEAALVDAEHALKYAREIGQAATLMYALTLASLIHIHCGNYATANTIVDELIALADEKGTLFWKTYGMVHQGCVLAQTGKASDAVQMITASIVGSRSTGSTLWTPYFLSYLARAYAEMQRKQKPISTARCCCACPAGEILGTARG